MQPADRRAGPAADVEEDGAAGVRDGRIGIVADLDEPAIGEVAVPHLLFLKPRRRILRIDDDVLVVVRVVAVIDPRVAERDRCERDTSRPAGSVASSV